jgi:hypothetical protein
MMNEGKTVQFAARVLSNFNNVSSFAIYLAAPQYIDTELYNHYSKQLHRPILEEQKWSICSFPNGRPFVIGITPVRTIIVRNILTFNLATSFSKSSQLFRRKDEKYRI